MTKGASFTTISGTRATFSAVGEVTIEASQDGNSTVAAAAPISRTFRVKRPVLLQFDNIATMGSQQQFDVVATVHEIIKRNSSGVPTETRVLSGAQAPVPVYSISNGPATVVGSKVTCGYLASGASPVSVTIRAIVMSNHYMTTSKETSFTIDSSKTGQRIELTNEKDGKGGFRPIPISPRPVFIGKIFKSTSGLALDYSISGDSKCCTNCRFR